MLKRMLCVIFAGTIILGTLSGCTTPSSPTDNTVVQTQNDETTAPNISSEQTNANNGADTEIPNAEPDENMEDQPERTWLTSSVETTEEIQQYIDELKTRNVLDYARDLKDITADDLSTHAYIPAEVTEQYDVYKLYEDTTNTTYLFIGQIKEGSDITEVMLETHASVSKLENLTANDVPCSACNLNNIVVVVGSPYCTDITNKICSSENIAQLSSVESVFAVLSQEPAA